MSLREFALQWGDFWAPAVLSFLHQTWFGDNRGDLLFWRASWLVDFLFQGLEFLAFVRMNALTYEWSLGSLCEPIRSAAAGILATVGGACAAAANQRPSDCGLLFWIFQLFFIHKKREGKLEKTSIHKNLPWHESPDMFFFFCPDKLKELHFVYLISSLPHPPLPRMTSNDRSQAGKSGTTSAGALYIKKKKERQNWRESEQENALLHSCGFKSAPQEKPTGFKVLLDALYTRPTEWWNAGCLLKLKWSHKDCFSKEGDRKRSSDGIWVLVSALIEIQRRNNKQFKSIHPPLPLLISHSISIRWYCACYFLLDDI